MLSVEFCCKSSGRKCVTAFTVVLRFLAENIEANLLVTLPQQVLSVWSDDRELTARGESEAA